MPTIATPQNRMPYDAPNDDARPRDSRAGRSHSLLVRARVGIQRGELTEELEKAFCLARAPRGERLDQGVCWSASVSQVSRIVVRCGLLDQVCML
jgi:hypothetical protein